ncbi:MAG: amino acid deaminase/aldolase [Mycetocola sp.]
MIDLSLDQSSGRSPVRSPAAVWSELDTATNGCDGPVAALHLGALRFNTADMVRRAAGTPVRVASKSIRSRSLISSLLAVPGFSGVLAYSLPEALWLAETMDDIVIGYPSTDRLAIAQLGRSEMAAARVTLMIDSVAHLDLIDSVCAPGQRAVLRIAIDVDAAWNAPRPLGHVGVYRSPISTPEQAGALAHHIEHRDGFTLVGLMAYESQIAGVADGVPGRGAAAGNLVRRWMKRRSGTELRERRARIVDAVSRVRPLEFVNGGGTGSLEWTATDPSVTEIGAGSGLLAGHYFDGFEQFTSAPASGFGLRVARQPEPNMVTVSGGGWTASGPPGRDRLPAPVWPEGLSFVPREMAGEVQTPLRGEAARQMNLGDRVWFRHAKSGELAEHVTEFHVVDDGAVVASVPTYRGEGKAFL